MEYNQSEIKTFVQTEDLKTEIINNMTSEMELSFLCPECRKSKENKEKPTPNCPSCITSALSTLVDKALDMSDDQVLGALHAMKSRIIKPPTGDVLIPKKVKLPNGDVVIKQEVVPAEDLFNDIHCDLEATYKTLHNGVVTMRMWRRIVEIEALNRDIAEIDLNKVLSVIANRVQEEHPEPEPKEQKFILTQDEPEEEPETTVVQVAEAITKKKVTPELMKKCVELRKKGLSFQAIEKTLGIATPGKGRGGRAAHGSRGNNARRACFKLIGKKGLDKIKKDLKEKGMA